MPLPTTGNITLLEIQQEFGTTGLAASALAGIPGTVLGSPPPDPNIVPDRSMRDFMGLSACTYTLNDQGYSIEIINTPFYQLGSSSVQGIFRWKNTGILNTYQSTDGSFFEFDYDENWIRPSTSTCVRTVSSVNAAAYDLEFEYISGDLTTGSIPFGGSSQIILYSDIYPPFGTRINLAAGGYFPGDTSAYVNRSVIAESYTTGGPNPPAYAYDLVWKTKIYQAGTNNLLSESISNIYLYTELARS